MVNRSVSDCNGAHFAEDVTQAVQEERNAHFSQIDSQLRRLLRRCLHIPHFRDVTRNHARSKKRVQPYILELLPIRTVHRYLYDLRYHRSRHPSASSSQEFQG